MHEGLDVVLPNGTPSLIGIASGEAVIHADPGRLCRVSSVLLLLT
jgi:hypothetical protein